MTPAELVARRAALGLGQAALARHFGLTKVTVWRWEHARRPVPPWLAAALRDLELARQEAP